ncbi:hypothetical protein AJ78_07245 [Emergomyces pasteurianus Ep9510]|uniref:Uncharacterized protein n=1 Tax=Emergomyces pasteurianus Ep9510 TaxID=1447872 RepID=A0A1J9QAA4_9EURO|nr:hypothetical protein AJ78_07245 [Emergomyces pasteurianus Ep9510]
MNYIYYTRTSVPSSTNKEWTWCDTSFSCYSDSNCRDFDDCLWYTSRNDSSRIHCGTALYPHTCWVYPDKDHTQAAIAKARQGKSWTWCNPDVTCFSNWECMSEQGSCFKIAKNDTKLIGCGDGVWPHSCWSYIG